MNDGDYVDNDDDYRDLPVISEEHLHRELLEAREDIRADRLVSGETLLAEIDRKIAAYLKKAAGEDGKTFET